MPSCAEIPAAETPAGRAGELAGLYGEWRALAEELYGLAERQRDLLLAADDGPLQAVLDRKEALYLRTQTLSERAGFLTHGPVRHHPSPEREGEADAARDRLYERLTRLSALEAESRALLRGRLDRLGEEMEGIGRKRNLAGAYGRPGGPASVHPRFLDQKR